MAVSHLFWCEKHIRPPPLIAYAGNGGHNFSVLFRVATRGCDFYHSRRALRLKVVTSTPCEL